MNDNFVAMDLTTLLPVKDEDYTPNSYPQSDVKYARISFAKFFEKRPFDDSLLRAIDLPYTDGVFLAGGFAARLATGVNLAADIDLFFRNEESYSMCVRSFLQHDYVPAEADKDVLDLYHRWLVKGPVLNSKAFIQFTQPGGNWPVQAVRIRFYDTIEDVLDCFDFTCIQFGLDLGSKDVVFNPVAPLDHAARRLVQHRVESYDRVLKRVTKYGDKGFEPGPGFVIPERVLK